MTLLLLLAQVLTVNVPVNTPFTVAFEHQYAQGDKYRLWCDLAIVKNYSEAEASVGKSLTSNANGEYTFTLTAPGLSKGVHSCFISSYNEVGETNGINQNITVGGPPSIPVGFRVIVK